MKNDLKREYLEILRGRYRVADRLERSRIIDELVKNFGLHRKYCIRILNAKAVERRKSGRKKKYHEPEFVRHLKKLWIEMDQICSKKMTAALPLWLPFYDCPPAIKDMLLEISAAAIDRVLKPYKVAYRRSRRAGTKPGKLLKHIIPIKPFNHNIDEPGLVEADTVAHCGGSLAGSFIWSLDFTDTHTGWTEARAVWNKGATGVVDAVEDIEKELPFTIKSFNVDNGSEFLNHHLVNYFGPEGKKQRPLQLMTRSRPYRKNDNPHAEQKNWTHIRQLFGYERFDNEALIGLMNSIYKNEHRLLQNFFVPQVKLKTKLRIGSKYKKTYTDPKTPYQRLLECSAIAQQKKDELTVLYKSLDPFELRKQLQEKLKLFFKALKSYSDLKEAG